jgi:hypothetical protein
MNALFERTDYTVPSSQVVSGNSPLNLEVESSLVGMLLDAFHEEKVIMEREFLRTMREQHGPTLTKG